MKLAVGAVMAVAGAVLLAGCVPSVDPDQDGPPGASASTDSNNPDGAGSPEASTSPSAIPEVEWPAQAPMPGGYTQTGVSVSQDGNKVEKTATIPGADVAGAVSDLNNQWENAGATIVESDTLDNVGTIGAMMPDSSIVSVKITANSDGSTMTALMTWTKA